MLTHREGMTSTTEELQASASLLQLQSSLSAQHMSGSTQAHSTPVFLRDTLPTVTSPLFTPLFGQESFTFNFDSPQFVSPITPTTTVCSFQTTDVRRRSQSPPKNPSPCAGSRHGFNFASVGEQRPQHESSSSTSSSPPCRIVYVPCMLPDDRGGNESRKAQDSRKGRTFQTVRSLECERSFESGHSSSPDRCNCACRCKRTKRTICL